MNKNDINKHIRGESIFVDDISAPEGTLYAALFDSPIAHGRIKYLDITRALESNGVKGIFTAEDIPGQNQIGNIIADESLLADSIVDYIGEPIAIVTAESAADARAARKLIQVEFEELPVITDPREAYRSGKLIAPPVTFSMGDTSHSFKKCELIIEDKVDIGGQEHLYLETQGALAVPAEDGGIKIFSATQSPTAVQRAASNVLGIPMNKIEVDVQRLGGAFGGKEDQATPFAVMAALCASNLRKPVKLVLSRNEDLRMTGKRHPYSADYKLGLTKEGKILAYEVTFFQNAGAVADLSTAILERSLFHATNSYFIPNVKAVGISCKTNLPPNTAFRGFGGPQAMFVIEAAIYKAAEKLKLGADEIQQKNLIKERDTFYYGQICERTKAEACWDKLFELNDLAERKNEIERFNSANDIFKKGLAIMPITFGISFTSSFLNQASALVHIYTDGSVGISTAAVEMGQGVNEKMRKIAAEIFSIDISKVKIESTNTTRAANTSPTAASSGADMNGNAVLIACESLLGRLKTKAAELFKISRPSSIEISDEIIFVKGKKSELTWNELVSSAYFDRVSLSEQAFYATPGIYFDRKKNKGRPFAYHVFGTALIESTLDCLRGTYKINSVNIVHDFGKSLHRKIDLGQTEGAVVQGIGWLTMEELVQNHNGDLVSNSLSTYKIPDIYSAPEKINIHFLEDSENPFGPLQSKAIGEPPFMYGIGAYFSIMNAMKAFKPELNIKISAPLTPEKVLLDLYSS